MTNKTILTPDPNSRELENILIWASDVADSRHKGRMLGEDLVIRVPENMVDKIDYDGRFALDWLVNNGRGVGIEIEFY